MSETAITKLEDFSQTSVTAVAQANSDALQAARRTQQEAYDEAQGGHFDDAIGMVVNGTRDGAALAAIEADVAPRANRQYGMHTAPDATAGASAPEEPAGP